MCLVSFPSDLISKIYCNQLKLLADSLSKSSHNGTNWMWRGAGNFHRHQLIFKGFCFLHWVSHLCLKFIMLHFLPIYKSMETILDTRAILTKTALNLSSHIEIFQNLHLIKTMTWFGLLLVFIILSWPDIWRGERKSYWIKPIHLKFGKVNNLNTMKK